MLKDIKKPTKSLWFGWLWIFNKRNLFVCWKSFEFCFTNCNH